MPQVGFTREGKLVAVKATLYCNAGNSLDLSHSIMQRALLLGDNVYRVAHWDLVVSCPPPHACWGDAGCPCLLGGGRTRCHGRGGRCPVQPARTTEPGGVCAVSRV